MQPPLSTLLCYGKFYSFLLPPVFSPLPLASGLAPASEPLLRRGGRLRRLP